MENRYLISISGKNNLDTLKKITDTLNLFKCVVLDINEVVIFQDLTIKILIEIPELVNKDVFFKELLYTCYKLGLHINFVDLNSSIINFDHILDIKRYIITALAQNITTTHLSLLIDLVFNENLQVISIERLSAPKFSSKKSEGLSCIEMTLEGPQIDITSIRKKLLMLSQYQNIEVGIQEDTPYRRHRRLIAFDMDSTLIRTEVIDELAKRKGVGDKVKQITEKAMRGELDFKQSLEKRVSLLKGLPVEVLEEVASTLPLNDGAEKLIKNLKVLGYKIAIISGGFTYFGNYLKKKLGIDYVFANELEIRDGVLTGKVVGEIIDGKKKAEILKHIAEKENISLEQVIAVGDGANDLPMLNLAGLGIAFRAKPVVREGAKQSLTNVGLDAILYFLGIRDREVII